MKGYVYALFTIVILAGNESVQAQEKKVERQIRIYVDNDFLNVRGHGTDEAYTYGMRLDYFYKPVKQPRFLFSRIMPQAGDSSVNVYGWSLMQLAITPRDIKSTAYQPDDYPYSGALFLTHSRRSYNPQKQYGFQTELVLGIMGPASFAKEGQTAVHRLIHYQLPEGWQYQFDNAPLINVNFSFEKRLLAIGHFAELIGGTQVLAGTMMNGAKIYPMLRVGKMAPYFNGYIGQYAERTKGSKWQAYLIAKPTGSYTLTNALLTGGIGQSKVSKGPAETPPLQKLNWGMEYGAVVSVGHWALSYIQRYTSPLLKGLYSHEVGNICLYYSW